MTLLSQTCLAITMASSLVLTSACSKTTTSNVTLALKNAGLITPALLNNYQITSATDQTSNVTIDSLKIPVGDVGLSAGDELYGSSNSAYIYLCSGSTAAACEVELVGSSLTNLLGGAAGTNGGSLESGKTYNSVMVSTCPDSSSQNSNSYVARIKAHASIDGVTYYTQSASGYLTSQLSLYEYTSVTFHTCRNYTVLSQPLSSDGSALTFTLYIDLRDIAVAVGPSSSAYAGKNLASSCSLDSGTTPATNPYLCLNNPDVGGTVKSGDPTVERYLVKDTAQASSLPKIMSFFFDSDGNSIGGYVRTYVGAMTTESNSFTGGPSYFKKSNLEASKLYFTDYSGGTSDTGGNGGTDVTNKASTQGDFTILDFPRPALGVAPASLSSKQSSSGVDSPIACTVERLD